MGICLAEEKKGKKCEKLQCTLKRIGKAEKAGCTCMFIDGQRYVFISIGKAMEQVMAEARKRATGPFPHPLQCTCASF